MTETKLPGLKESYTAHQKFIFQKLAE